MANAIQKINTAHRAIAAWMVMNPTGTLEQCSREMGYTVPWLSRLVNSDMFQALIRELEDTRDLPGVQSIGDKIAHNAHLALDRMREKLEMPSIGVSEKFLSQSTGTLFKALGYDGGGELHIHKHDEQHVHLTAEDIAAARERAREVNAKEIAGD